MVVYKTFQTHQQRGMKVTISSSGLRSINVSLDDANLVANAGLLVFSTLSESLGLCGLIKEKVSLAGRVGGANPGRKILTLTHAMTAGANHIDHVDMLRAGSTQAVLGHKVMAPSTIGTFLRSFTFGHVRQLDSVVDTHQRRPRAVLRSKSPQLVYQEIWGHLCCHYAIRSLMAETAGHFGHDPDRISFTAALSIARRSVIRGDFPPGDDKAS